LPINKRMDEVIAPLRRTAIARAAAVRQMGENFDIIISEGERLTKLINGVLDLSKIGSGKMRWHISGVSVNQIGPSHLSHRFSVRAETVGADPSDRAVCQGARRSRQAVQVVINLLSNASSSQVTARHLPRGVSARRRHERVDTGISIAARTSTVRRVCAGWRHVD
jgi:signal transduction histidine kinase